MQSLTPLLRRRRPSTLPALVLAAAVVLPACGAPPESFSKSRGNADAITSAELRTHLEYIAGDELAGRATPSPGLDAAARYIAKHLEMWGLKPGGSEGGFLQPIPLKTTSLDMEKSSATVDNVVFEAGEDFLPASGPGAGSGEAVEGTLLYVGDGWFLPAKGRNPYAGLDVKGRILLVQQPPSGLPEGVTREDLRGQPGDAAYRSPENYARTHGALGLVTIPSFTTLANWRQQISFLTRSYTRPEDEAPDSPRLPEIVAGPRLLAALLRGVTPTAPELQSAALLGKSLPSFALPDDRKVRFQVASVERREKTQNVVGIWEGADPRLKQEYVALGAHYDHLGSSPGDGDRIYNGADDDGSGVVALMEIARSLSQAPRPRRSVIFVWHAGEERGLWGSRFFTDHSPVPVEKIVAHVNIDMIGRSKPAGDTERRNENLTGPNSIYVIGPAVMSRDLGRLLDDVNRDYLKLDVSDRYDKTDDPRRYFFRSDHLNYIRKGIPSIFFFAGEHVDYHRPSDEVDRIDFQKLEKVTRTIAALVWRLAEQDGRPRVDRDPLK